MSRFIDLTNMVFGRLTVIKRAEDRRFPSGGVDSMWECRCVCGRTCVVSGGNLRKGNTQSCGCFHKEKVAQMGKDNTKHGAARHNSQSKRIRLYTIWKSMRERCNNKNHSSYKYYGGRGIEVCPEWESFSSFKKWALENGYSDNLSIDRIDVNGNYAPSNCRWADNVTQSNNRRNVALITIGCQTKCLSDWAKTSGVPVWKIRDRLRKGLQGNDLIALP